MPLVTLDEYGQPAHWAHKEPDYIDIEPINQTYQTVQEMYDDILGPEKKHYFWLGPEAEEIEDDGWITVHGTTV